MAEALPSWTGWIVGAMGASTALFVTVWNLYFKTKKDSRNDALSEYKDIVTRLDQRNGELHKEVIGLYQSHAECMRENAEIKARLIVLDARIVFLESEIRRREDAADKLAIEQSKERQQPK